jgi:hypothetical protein
MKNELRSNTIFYVQPVFTIHYSFLTKGSISIQ